MKKITETSVLSGASKRQLQFYDNEELMTVKRSKTNYRMYDDAALQELWEIMIYKETGMELQAIKELVHAPEDEKGKHLEAYKEEMKKKVDALEEQVAFMEAIIRKGMPKKPREAELAEGKTYVDMVRYYRKNFRE